MASWKKKDFIISTDKSLLNLDVIYNFLHNESYWAKERPRNIIEKSIENSLLCFGIYKVYKDGLKEQVGFARVITDMATFAYLCDVFVLPKYRGLGLSKGLMEVITSHPDLKTVRRIMLVTFDAHTLYAKYGFQLIDTPQHFMQLIRNNGNEDNIPYIIDEQDEIC